MFVQPVPELRVQDRIPPRGVRIKPRTAFEAETFSGFQSGKRVQRMVSDSSSLPTDSGREGRLPFASNTKRIGRVPQSTCGRRHVILIRLRRRPSFSASEGPVVQLSRSEG